MKELSRYQEKGEIGKLIFFFSLFVAAGIVIFTLPRLAFPLGLAYVLFLVTSPAVPGLMKLGISRGISIAIVFVGVIFFSTYPFFKVVPMVVTEANNLQGKFSGIETYLKKNYIVLKEKVKEKTGYELGDKLLTTSVSYGKDFFTTLVKVVPDYLAKFVEWLFIVPLFLFFFLRDSRSFKSYFLKLVPNSIFERIYYLSYQFNKQLGDYIFAKAIEAGIVGVIITLGLSIMGVKFAFLLGIVAGITNIVPYVGPFLGVIPALVIGMMEYGLSPQFGGIVMLYVIANAVDLALVFPILVSKIVNLHPILVVVSVILGSHFFGILGMIISIPLLAALKLVFTTVQRELYSTHHN